MAWLGELSETFHAIVLAHAQHVRVPRAARVPSCTLSCVALCRVDGVEVHAIDATTKVLGRGDGVCVAPDAVDAGATTKATRDAANRTVLVGHALAAMADNRLSVQHMVRGDVTYLSRIVSIVPRSAFWIFLRSVFQALSLGSQRTRAKPQVEANAPAASTSQVSNTKSVQNSAPNKADRPWLCESFASLVGDISLLSKSWALRRVDVVLKSCRIRLSAPQSTSVDRSVCSKTSKACSISLFMGMRGWRAIFRPGLFFVAVLRVFRERGGWRSRRAI